jgi:hypothetical protein
MHVPNVDSRVDRITRMHRVVHHAEENIDHPC